MSSGSSQTEWRVIPGYEEYEVSEFGDLRRRFRAVNGHKKLELKPRWVGGYRRAYLMQNGKMRTTVAHRMVALAFLGLPLSPRHVACHNDGNPANNHVSNIRWATQKENLADRRLHGTSGWGPNHHNKKMTMEGVQDIRQRFAKGEKSIRQLAAIHGMSRLAISDIVRNKSWVDSSKQS